MGTENNVQTVKDFFTAMGNYDRRGLLALAADDIEWTIPGKGWSLAGTHRGHAGLAAVLQKASDEVDMTYPKPPEFVAQGNRVIVIGVATGAIKATKKPFRDEWVLRHHRSGWQGGTHTGVRRYASAGAGLFDHGLKGLATRSASSLPPRTTPQHQFERASFEGNTAAGP